MTWRTPLLLVPLLLLAGCSGTPLGDQLSGSFSPGSTPAPGGAEGPRPTTGNAAGRSNGSAGQPPSSPATGADRSATTTASPGNSTSQNPASGSRRSSAPPRPASTPAPYRVTIKLPAADPSAPAEALTEALRSAGLSFEVETIERVGPGANSRTPVATPAPPVR